VQGVDRAFSDGLDRLVGGRGEKHKKEKTARIKFECRKGMQKETRKGKREMDMPHFVHRRSKG